METTDLLKAKIPCEETGITVKTGLCGFCGGACPVDVYFQNGKVIKVEGSKNLPGSTGRMCVKGAALKQALYSPKRLLYPMKRTGKRGEGQFQRISWDEAIDIIAEKLNETKEKYDAKSTLFYVGHPKWFRVQATELANAYGSPNFGTESSTCAYAAMMACQTVFGAGVRMMPTDLRNCKTLCLWGGNQLHSSPMMMGPSLFNALDSGMKLVVVDPRCTPITERAHIHLRPIPGTDCALALGLAHIIITENRQNQEYIDRYTSGYEEYRDYVMQFTPEKVEELTGVPREDLIAAARLLADGPIQMTANSLVHHINGVQSIRAVMMLLALTGSYGMPGGTCPPLKGRAGLKNGMGTIRQRVRNQEDLSHQQFPGWAKLCPHEIQVTRLADYVEGQGDYPIRSILAFGMNHHMWPRPDRIEQALEKVDFFVNADIYMTDTCKYADIILPVQASLEREQLQVVGPDTVYYQGHVVEPAGESRSDMDILTALAARMDLQIGEDIPISSHEDFLRMSLTPTGLTLEEVKEEPFGVKAKVTPPSRTREEILQAKTPSGKIEFVSSVLASCNQFGHDGLPVYRDIREVLPLAEYPLILSAGCRKPQLFHSRCYRHPWLAGLEKHPLVEVCPEDAAAMNMKDGDVVTVTTPVGSMDFMLFESTAVRKGTVCIYHGAGENDVNYIMDDHYLDPISGFPGYKSYCCRLEKKEG